MARNIPLLEAFATEIRHRRNGWKFSQEELAGRAGINRTYVAKLELAKNQPTLSVLLELARALNCSLPELIEGTLSRYKNRPRKSPDERMRALLQGKVANDFHPNVPMSVQLIEKISRKSGDKGK